MNALQKFLDTPGIELLEHYDRESLLNAGYSTAKVNQWRELHHVYFGPSKFAKLQPRARELARAGGFSIEQLLTIEGQVAKISSPKRRMVARLKLLAVKRTHKAMLAFAKKLLPKPEPKPAPDSITFSPSKAGKRRMTVTCDERDLADLEHALRDGMESDDVPVEHMLAGFLNMLRSGGGVPRAVPRPIVLVPVAEHLALMRGEGDETVFGLTDGTTISGSELLAREYGADLEIALVHPQHGAVNLYRSSRFANDKQRALASLMCTGCPVPECRHGADACESHHIVPWAAGGETNVSNLVPLCRYHNRVNDDDPSRPSRGRIEVMDGVPTWVSPQGYPRRNTLHPDGAMQLLFGSQYSGTHA